MIPVIHVVSASVPLVVNDSMLRVGGGRETPWHACQSGRRLTTTATCTANAITKTPTPSPGVAVGVGVAVDGTVGLGPDVKGVVWVEATVGVWVGGGGPSPTAIVQLSPSIPTVFPPFLRTYQST